MDVGVETRWFESERKGHWVRGGVCQDNGEREGERRGVRAEGGAVRGRVGQSSVCPITFNSSGLFVDISYIGIIALEGLLIPISFWLLA